MFGRGRAHCYWPASWPTEWQYADPRYDPDSDCDPRFRRIPAATEMGNEGDY